MYPYRPLFPERWWAGSFDKPAPSPDNLKIMQFLDQAVTRFGKHSVLYIRLIFLILKRYRRTLTGYYSFGTLFFPAGRPDQIQLLIKSLLAADPPMPFVFGTAGAPPSLVNEISAMLTKEENSTMGIICGFAPQMFILNHVATGFFLVRIILISSLAQILIFCLYSLMGAQTLLLNQSSPRSPWCCGPFWRISL